MIRICLAEPCPVYCTGLKHELESTARIRVVGEAATPEELSSVLHRGGTDILLLNTLFGEDGCAPLLRRLELQGFRERVILHGRGLSCRDLAVTGCRGVHGLIDTDDAGQVFCEAVETVARGGRFNSATVDARSVTGTDEESAMVSLTPTERLVLHLLREHMTSREIADHMFISTQTVQKHRANISRKLHLHGSNALLAFVLRSSQVAGIPPPILRENTQPLVS
jgi:DNA-binding NarL/FixJ family response regulator